MSVGKYKEESRNTGKDDKSIYTKKILSKGGEKPYRRVKGKMGNQSKPELTMEAIQLYNCI